MSRRKKVGWGDDSIGPSSSASDDGLDLDDVQIWDLFDAFEDETPQSYTHKCVTSKCKKKTWKGPKLELKCPSCKKPCEAWDSDDDGLEDDEVLVGVGSGANRTKTVKKKPKRKGKKRSETKLCSACKDGYHAEADCENPPWEDQGPEIEEPALEQAAAKFEIDISMECPVCRSLEACGCEEEDRAFVRRTRFQADVKKVARCPRCEAPLSVVYLPRPGIKSVPFRLAQFEALYACSCCHNHALATVILSVQR